MSKEVVPQQQQAWDSALDVALRRTVYGALAGGVAALLLFRECGEERGGGARGREGAICGRRVRAPPTARPPPPQRAGSPAGRTAAVAFGTGFGAGSAYQQSQAVVSAWVVWGARAEREGVAACWRHAACPPYPPHPARAHAV